MQSRPITTLGQGAPESKREEARKPALVTGLGASPGRVTGKVRVLSRPEEGGRLKKGEVLVAPMTSPDWVATMRRAVAIITDSGGMTSHAAIVSRELRLPCVVGTRNATRVLRDGEEVTVDGRSGEVFEGRVEEVVPPRVEAARLVEAPRAVAAGEPEPLATELYVNLALPGQAREAAALPVDGVGLLRAEFLLTDALGGVHPRKLIAEGRQREFVERMVGPLLEIARAFHPRPVVYRTTDFRTNEFRGLEGGAEYEPGEANPMIGFRGCYRYLREPEVFRLELEALARVREQSPNLHVMIPFVRTLWELEACLELMDTSPLGRQRGLERWVMAEVPSVVYRIPEYARLGVTGVSIGSNDLTQLMLGVDRDSETCAELFDESDAAVLDAIVRIIRASREAGMTCSLCGRAPRTGPSSPSTWCGRESPPSRWTPARWARRGGWWPPPNAGCCWRQPEALLRDMKISWNMSAGPLAVSAGGLLVGGLAWLFGNARGADLAWAVGTVPVLVVVAGSIVTALRQGNMGVDIIALLSMAGSLALGQFLAGIIIALMFSTGRALEDHARARARRELSALLGRAPKVATRYEDGGLEQVPVESLRPGDRLLIKGGEVIPVDGLVLSAGAVLDESALTGESLPVSHETGERVRSGPVNAGPPFELRALTTAAESTYAGVVRLVQSAQASKAPFARMADRYALLFVPFTLALAALAWVLSGEPVRALSVLVVATPCPLLLAVPVAIVSGISRAARRGVLIKDGTALETLARAHVLLFDKTGTLTTGQARLTAIETMGDTDPRSCCG
ncbi:HAD-IC family P-type ATPase [Cystobacter fuscus]